jgi:hypothetical protein
MDDATSLYRTWEADQVALIERLKSGAGLTSEWDMERLACELELKQAEEKLEKIRAEIALEEEEAEARASET